MSKEKKGPEWFKVHRGIAIVARRLDPLKVGEGFIAALNKFTGRDPGELDRDSGLIYDMLLESIEEAQADYTARVEDGKRGAASRWNSPPIAPLSEGVGIDREETRTEETRTEPEREADAEQPTRAYKREELLTVCDREGITIDLDAFMQDMERCGWTLNGKPIKSIAAVMKWWKGQQGTGKRINPARSFGDFEQNKYNFAELERELIQN